VVLFSFSREIPALAPTSARKQIGSFGWPFPQSMNGNRLLPMIDTTMYTAGDMLLQSRDVTMNATRMTVMRNMGDPPSRDRMRPRSELHDVRCSTITCILYVQCGKTTLPIRPSVQSN
jgi:hypothetical protein